MDVFFTFNDWIRLLILVAGVLIGGFMINLAKKKWQEVIGIITLLLSIIVPILVEARMWWTRSHSMYDSDWEIIQVWLSSSSPQSGALLLFLYVLPLVLWIICLSQIIRIIVVKIRSKYK